MEDYTVRKIPATSPDEAICTAISDVAKHAGPELEFHITFSSLYRATFILLPAFPPLRLEEPHKSDHTANQDTPAYTLSCLNNPQAPFGRHIDPIRACCCCRHQYGIAVAY